MEPFPRVVTPSSAPYDPLELAEASQEVVCRPEDGARKYTAVYVAGVYGGIATAYAVGCSLRCTSTAMGYWCRAMLFLRALAIPILS